MDEREARERFASAPVARLATTTPDGAPHLVPVTFAVLEDDTIWFLVDEKPKRSRELQRLANIAADGRVSLLVDHYDDAWSALWWVRADGRARVITDPELWRGALAALVRKYPQYASEPPSGPAVEIRIERWRWWAAR